MTDITGQLMSGDNVIATVKNGIITDYMDEIPIKADRDYIRSFILGGQEKVREIICADIEPTEDNTIGIML